jgi:hypothetical protein
VEIEPPEVEETAEGYVYGWRKDGFTYSVEDVEVELPDGSRLRAEEQLEGQRIGFDRALPAGSWILLRGRRMWGPVGDSE